MCADVLGGQPCYAGLQQAAEGSPDVLAALGFALGAGLAARVKSLSEDAEAEPDPEAAQHIYSAGCSLTHRAMHSVWAAAASDSDSQLPQQAAVQALEAADAALRLAALQPSLPAGAPDIQLAARRIQLWILPRLAALIGWLECDELAAHARQVLLRAAPSAVAALRTAASTPEQPLLFGDALRIWCCSVEIVASEEGRQRQAAEQQLHRALAAAAALLRLLPLLDAQPIEDAWEVDAKLLQAGSAALAMLGSVADCAASWADA